MTESITNEALETLKRLRAAWLGLTARQRDAAVARWVVGIEVETRPDCVSGEIAYWMPHDGRHQYPVARYTDPRSGAIADVREVVRGWTGAKSFAFWEAMVSQLPYEGKWKDFEWPQWLFWGCPEPEEAICFAAVCAAGWDGTKP